MALDTVDVIAALRRLLHYRTTAHECDCPDWQYRRRQLLQPCKHIVLFHSLQPQLEAIKIMPIKGLTTDRQEMLPRIGKIRLGIKKKHSNGREYPAATDYFVCPPEVQAIYGPEPKELTIVLPTADPEVVAPTWYKAYQLGRGLACKGDGETANRLIADGKAGTDEAGRPQGPLPTRDDEKVDWHFGLRCPGRQCPDYEQGNCREMMNFQFLMPDVEGYGVWQMDTGSYHGITGIYDSLAYLKLFGDVAGVPLRLTLEPKEVSPDGRKKTVHVPRLTHAGKLADMLQAVERPRWALSAAVMPEPDEDPDDLMLAPSDYAPDGVVPLDDYNDDSNGARMRRVAAGAPATLPAHDPATGEIREEAPAEPPRQTIGQLIAACETPEQYTALMRRIFEGMESGQRRDKMLARISHTAEETGYVVDMATLEVTAVEYDEIDPEEAPTPEPEAVAESVICVECGEEVSEAQVNDVGVCSLCTALINAVTPATEEPATALI